MIQVSGLTENQIIDIISKVADNHKGKAFDYHTDEDIKQEVWIIAINQIKEFDIEKANQTSVDKALENFLNNLVAKRLSNFYRDKFAVKQRKLKTDKSEFDQQKRINLRHPLDIDEVVHPEFVEEDYLVLKEYWELILENITLEEAILLNDLLNGYNIGCYYKGKLFKRIMEIINE